MFFDFFLSRLILLKLLFFFFYRYHQDKLIKFIKMADLSEFKKGQIFGVPMAGASVTKTAELFRVIRSTISKVMTAFEKEGKTSHWSKNSGRKLKLSDKGRQTLKRIVRKDHKNKAPKITAELNDRFENPVSSKTVRRKLHKARFHGRAAIRKPY